MGSAGDVGGEVLQVGDGQEFMHLLDANRFCVVDNQSHTCADSVALAIIVGMGFFLKVVYIMCISMCLHVCVHTVCVSGAQRRPGRIPW